MWNWLLSCAGSPWNGPRTQRTIVYRSTVKVQRSAGNFARKIKEKGFFRSLRGQSLYCMLALEKAHADRAQLHHIFVLHVFGKKRDCYPLTNVPQGTLSAGISAAPGQKMCTPGCLPGQFLTRQGFLQAVKTNAGSIAREPHCCRQGTAPLCQLLVRR